MGLVQRKSRFAHLLLASILLAVPGCGSTDGPGDTARQFVTDVAQGRQGEALERVDPQLRQIGGMMLGMSLAQETARARQAGGLKDVRVLKAERNDDLHYSVTTEITYKDGSSRTDTGKLRLIDGRWFVTS
jgi:hypothetical protein